MKSFRLKEFQIVVIGPQGSGKGTQSLMLAPKFDFSHIPLGDILKGETLTEALTVKINRGELLTDEEVFSILKPHLKKFKEEGVTNFIFDGIPRTPTQVAKLKKLLLELGFSSKLLYIFLEVDDNTTIERISKRRVCDRCRKIFYPKNSEYTQGRCGCGGKLVVREDDKEEAVQKRLKVFHQKTKKVLDSLAQNDRVLKIDGKPSVEEVFTRIVKGISSLK